MTTMIMQRPAGRLAMLALGACLTMGACADSAGDVDTASAFGEVATPAIGGAGTGSMEALDDEPRSDAEILTRIAHGNDAELAYGRLAQQRATSASVKAFARQMVAEHVAMQEQQEQLAKSLAAPGTGETTVDPMEDADALEALKEKRGADFDRAYMDIQVLTHENVLDDLRVFQGRAQDEELRSLIAQALTRVQSHLEKARTVRQELGS